MLHNAKKVLIMATKHGVLMAEVTLVAEGIAVVGSQLDPPNILLRTMEMYVM